MSNSGSLLGIRFVLSGTDIKIKDNMYGINIAGKEITIKNPKRFADICSDINSLMISKSNTGNEVSINIFK